MGKSPSFQTYAADFFMDTNEWTVEEVGIYWRLLLSEWVNESIPNDEKRLARIVGCSLKKFQKSWSTILIKFIPNGDSRFQNPRMEEVRENQRKYSQRQAEKGKQSARLRFNRGSTVVQPEGQPEGNRKSTLLSSSSLINNNRKFYYRDSCNNFVCKTCLRIFSLWENFQAHDCIGDKFKNQSKESGVV